MRYPIFIEEGTDTAAFGIVVPDLAGCFAAGDTLDEAVGAAWEAAAAWIDTARDRGVSVPRPSTVEQARNLPGYKAWAVGLIELETSLVAARPAAAR